MGICNAGKRKEERGKRKKEKGKRLIPKLPKLPKKTDCHGLTPRNDDDINRHPEERSDVGICNAGKRKEERGKRLILKFPKLPKLPKKRDCHGLTASQ